MNHNIFIEEHGQLLKYIHKQESDQKIVESEPRKKKEKIKKKNNNNKWNKIHAGLDGEKTKILAEEKLPQCNHPSLRPSQK